MRIAGASGLLLMAVLVTAAPASAGTVERVVLQPAQPPIDAGPINQDQGHADTPKIPGSPEVSSVGFRADPGEANRLVVTDEAGVWHVRDDGAPLAVKGGCKQISDHEATCAHASSPFGAMLGDGDDRAEISGAASANGGAGNDVLVGGSDGQSLDGGPGADSVSGGADDDILSGGTDTDPDTVDGGAGEDQVSWENETRPVSADLADPARDGVAADDLLIAIEDLVGGAGDDVLTGDAAVNRLAGGAGADWLNGGPGRDLLRGDAGDDTLSAAGESAGDGDTLVCMDGNDTVASPSLLTLASGYDCEHIEPILDTSGVVYRRGILRVPVLCPVENEHGCNAVVRIARGSRKARGHEASIPNGTVGTASVRLPAVLSAAARRGVVRLSVDILREDASIGGGGREGGHLAVRL